MSLHDELSPRVPAGPAPGPAPARGSLVDLLRWRAEERPYKPALTFLSEGEQPAERLSYGDLDHAARSLAALLQERTRPGDRVLLVFPPGLGFITAFFGCLYAGVIAVPAYPPRSGRGLGRLLSIVRDARPQWGLTTAALQARLAPMLAGEAELRDVGFMTLEEAGSRAEPWRDPGVSGDTLAFLQYTSGSTAAPKGVMVSHGNILHNERMIQEAFGQSEDSVVVGWLPLYHDMGLIGNVLQPLYLGAQSILLSPAAFLQQPLRWLQAVSDHRATTSGGPNFAYELCLQKIRPEQIAGLDLSSWTVAYSGAEPVRADTLERFAETFAVCGFRPEALYPCYGLAEATLFVAGGAPGRPPRVRPFAGADLEQGQALPAEGNGASVRRLVSCGHAWGGQHLAIVDPATETVCPEGRVGEIWVAGPGVALGYWGRPEETARTFGAVPKDGGLGPFLRTGDLGFVRDGELFVTGRLKDLILLRGRNLYPQDLELTAERSHQALRAGCGAAFVVEGGREDRLVIVQEVERRREAESGEALEAVRRDVAEEHEILADDVVLVRAGTIPKTSSGKIRRHACRDAYRSGTLQVVARTSPVPEAASEEAGEELPSRAALLGQGAADRRRAVESFVALRLARALRVDPSRIDPAVPVSSLGADSLAAMELAGELRELGGAGAPGVADVLSGASVAELAAGLLRALEEAPEPAATPPAAEEPRGDHPLSRGQQALWFLHRLAPESAAYHIAVAARCRGGLDPERLRTALKALVERHPALRTTFFERGGAPWQRVHPGLAVDFRIEDASSALEAESLRPFDLESGPLLRVRLFLRPSGEAVVLLVLHHIVADFWSMAILARDLGRLYGGTGALPGDSAPRRSYADHVRWEARWLAGEEGERSWRFWRDRLAGAPPALELPTDRPRPAVQTYAGDSVAARWSPRWLEEIRSLARQRGATLHMVLVAALRTLLFRSTGEEDAVLGSPVSGRGPGFQDVAGYFVNPLPLRVGLHGGLTFPELLDGVRRLVLPALEHQHYPFPLLVERLVGERDPGRSPLFQVMLVLQKVSGPGAEALGAFAVGEAGVPLELEGLLLESVPLPRRTAQLDLTLLAAETGDGLGLCLEYNTDLLDRATAERLLGHLETLLAGALETPERRLSELPVLTAAERGQLVVEWNRTGTPGPAACLPEMLAAQAERTPEAGALVAEDRCWSYRELMDRAGCLAGRLRELGVQPEIVVGLCTGRSAGMVAGFLGILQAGGVCVALDPAYPEERIAFTLADSGASLVVAARSERLRFASWPGRTVVLEDVLEDVPAPGPPKPVSEPEHLAYLIYTSGSTGRPKGVAIEHRSAAALVQWSREVWADAELAGVLFSTSLCFDLSIFELLVPLCRGGRVILAENALELPRLAASGEVTLVNTVPSVLGELLRSGGLPASVRTVNLAGEPLRGSLVEEIRSHRPGARVLNLYGPSEDTTYSTWAEIAAGDVRPPSIGRPIAGTRLYLLGPGGEPVPVGVIGDLYLGGAGLARGYHARPELTAERFVPDALSGLSGERLYRTGDLGRYRPDGEVEFLGRVDDQVKVRGFRIEPGEVETLLARHAAVKEAALLVREEAGGGSHLVACVAGEAGTEEELLAWLRQRLPAYLLPSAFVYLESLPRTVSGKVDRRALARRIAEEGELREAGPGTAPRTPVEELLAGLWGEVLGLEGLRRENDFFLLGGHSLLATQVVSRVREAFGVELPLVEVFRHSRLAGLAAAIQARLEGGEAGPVPPIRPVPRDEDLPLSFAQERLWFLDRLQPDSPVYNMPLALRVEGALSVPALEASLAAVVGRQEALRTHFAERRGRPVQVIADEAFPGLPVVDLAALPAGPAGREIHRLTAEEAVRPFDLTRSVLRSLLLRRSAGEHVLLLTLHHIAADGWSLGVLLDEVRALYPEPRAGVLPALPVQYADFAVWQREWLGGGELARQMAFWRRCLEGAPASLDLPFDRPRPPVQSFRGGSLRFEVPGERLAGLKRLGRQHSATLFMVLLAAVAALLRRWSRQDDMVLGTPIANRTRLETERLVGFFVNTLALRQDLSGDPPFSGLLERVRQGALAAYAHQDLPFELLVEELRPERHLSHNPLFQVMFALQNAPFGRLELPGLTLSRLEPEGAPSKFDLGLTFTEAGPGLEGTVDYSADLFDAATVRRLADHLGILLTGALEAPERRLSELPVLTAGERHQLVAEWNDTAAGEEPRGVVELFEEQVRRSPGAPALDACDPDGGSYPGLTYAELNARANRLAHVLAGLGVGPGMPVGLSAERSPDLVAGLLGILKAGGACVPLDPALPPSRLAFLLGDSAVPVLVTQRRVAAGLPAEAGARRIVLLDGEEMASASEADPEAVPRPEDLAYMIYTSGTTGRPKAVLVTHGSLAATLAATRQAFAFGPRDRMPCLAPFSFDIFLFELFSPLLAGGAAVLFPLRPTLDVERLVSVLSGPEPMTLLHAVPSLMRQIVTAVRHAAPRRSLGEDLRLLFVGGDTVPAELLADLRETFPQAGIRVLYGPTEGTILATRHPVPAMGPVRSLLGRPLAGVTLELRDEGGGLVPTGGVGEIWLGGPGVACGYWGQPSLTAERFVPRHDGGGERVFRTGDLARRLPDGTLEFLGRLDHQVKIRGFRIELGEVESVLARHPDVEEAVVVAREAPGQASAGRQLVAYVVRDRDSATAARLAEEHDQVLHWQTLYEETYGRPAGVADPTLNLEGWNSSYTGLPIPEDEMREWVEETVSRIRRLGPRRVLEVGCGTGLLLFRLAPETELYHGTDFSREALELVRRQLQGPLSLPQVRLDRRLADEWSEVAPGSFDLVVLNSVVQYFPDGDYLVRVLESAVRAVAPGGSVFVGDVRSLPLLESFHISVALSGAAPETTVTELRRRVRRRVADEEELVVAPAFFAALKQRLPEIQRVEILLKRGRHHNELTRFRYDVVLHADGRGEEEGRRPETERFSTLEALQERLLRSSPDVLAVTGIPNGRLAEEAAALELLSGAGQDLETVAELREALGERRAAAGAVDPQALCDLGERSGYAVELVLPATGDGFRLTAVLSRAGSPAGLVAADAVDAPVLEWSAYVNDPLRGKLARRLVPRLRRFLKSELPDYMVPAAFLLLDSLPLTAHGKVDPGSLPAPDSSRPDAAGPYAAPRTPLESALAEVWSELLGVERVGVEDSFFELGGHSLLAIQVISRVRDLFHAEIPLRSLFEGPTVADLARLIEEERGAGVSARILPVERKGELPLSFAQERLWFIDQMTPGSPLYNMPAALEAEGDPDVEALASSLSRIVARHEALRTRFLAVEGRPVQRIDEPAPVPVPVIDGRTLPEAGLRQVMLEEVHRPFDLSRGPLLRALLLRVEERRWWLLLTLHHIVSDGWSMGVLVREVSALYTARKLGTEAALPELPVQYADFARWQREWLSGEVLEQEMAYWRRHLEGAPPLLGLPLDRPRPAMLSTEGATRRFVLPHPVSAELTALSRRTGSTLFMALLAAFQALLWRWSGQRDLSVGTPIAGRNRAEIEPLIGFFVNTLVLRAEIDPGGSFTALLSQAREESLSAYTHQDVPFEKLVEGISPQRSLGYSPLFQVMFALQEAASNELDLPGLRLRPVELDPGVAKFDLSLDMSMQADGRLAGAVNYNTSLFDASTAVRLVQHLEVLLESASASAETRLDELDWLAEAERHQLTAEWRESASPYPQLCVHELFEEQARLRPDEPAVQFLEEQVSYGELNRRANRLAHLLRSRGVGPETRVGLCVERSVALVAGMLGILKAGGVYVPLDPSYPAERLAAMLTDAGAALVVIEPERLGELPDEWEMLLLGEEEGQPETDPGNGASLENLAYLIYTSGTTDRPRGVMVEHGQWLHTLSVAAERFGPKASDRMACLASFSFDISLLELMLPLLAGGRVLLVSREELLSPTRLVEILTPVTLLHGVPSLMRHVVEWLRSASKRLDELRTVFVGGEAVEADLLARMREVFSPADLVVLYGPTEAAIICSSHDVPRHGEPQGRRLGRPLPGVEMQVVDAAGRRVAMGIEGELWVGGPGVSRGYLGRPELTADRFRPASGGGRFYRTGDLARYTGDGTLEFLGRADGQVKVRGFRIEPGEIERVMLMHPQVQAAAVVVRTDSGDSRLVAYVVGEELEVASLREHVSRALPQHMVPSLFVKLKALPLLPNGKVDRRDLEQRTLSGLQKAKEWVAPRTPAEELMAGLWAEVLDQERVGAEDNFFDLGGHSLLGTQLISRVRHAFGVELPLRMLFERPTVAGLSRAVEEMQRAEEGLQVPPITRTERTGELPLSYAQERLWLIDQITPDSPLYNVPVGLELEGDLDVEALAWSLSEVVRRHEALRTRFQAVEGRPVQVIDEPAAVPVPVIDGRTLPEAALRQVLHEEAHRPFDLSRGPLLRAMLLRAGEQRWWLLLNLHHIVSDGWSMGVLVREVSALYAARRQGTALALPELPVQYADFAQWQRDWLAEGMLEKELSYWRQRLAGAPPLLELPLDRPRPAVLSMQGGMRPFLLPHSLSTELTALSRRSDMTLFMTILAGFQALLWRWSGQRDLSVGTPIAGRNRVETEALIGFFVNTLVLRAQIDPAESFNALLGRTREAALGAYTHQDVPFEKVVEELSPQRSLSYSPLFQVMLTVQEEAREELALPGLRLRQLEMSSGVAKFDLIVAVSRRRDGGLSGVLSYNATLFEASTAERLVRHLEGLLENAVASPDSRLDELAWLGASERHQLLAEWSDTASRYPQASVHELFEERARRHPDRRAVEFADGQVSYGELNRRANRLAYRLRSRGVGPETRVGLCMERSAQMVVGMLGILKSGGAYVPLDPSYPAERLEAMVEDAAVSLVVSEPERLAELPAGWSLLLPADWEEGPEEDLPSLVGPESTAYVTFTSGSTGRPKGIMVPHRAVVRLVRDTNYIDLGSEDRVAQASNATFDAATFEVWGALLSGGVLVGIRREVTLSPRSFAEALGEGRVSALFLTTALFNQVAREAPGAFASLRHVLFGGEAVDPQWVQEVLAKGRPGRLLHVYGPTEATTFSTWHLVEAVEEGARTIPIGRGLSNARTYLVDPDQRLVPVGVAGELLLGGDGLARGYERRPDLTAESFVPDGLSGERGARLYRTGDVARWDREGRIEYLGRRDHQVKVRGFRIELSEIETVLSEHPSVAQAVVLARQVESEGWSDRQLVAWVVPADGMPGGELGRELRRYAGSRLPVYMVPSQVIAVAELPLTPVGKVDRKALERLRGTEDLPETGELVAPRTPYEELVAQAWEELLGRGRIGVDQDFFELGGHSLLATQVVSRLQKMFDLDIPLRALFENPTVERLARYIEKAQWTGLHPSAPPVVPVPRTGDLSLSFAQERLWLIDQITPGSPLYNLPVALELEGELSLEAVEWSLSEVVRRHEALRTRFLSVDGRPVQVADEPSPVPVPVVDGRGAPEAELRRLMLEEALRPFDLVRGPLLRALLVRVGEQRWQMLLNLHHIVSDGWSLGLLVREVSALYTARVSGTEAHLPELPVQYADFSCWQREWLSGEVLEQEMACWRQRLEGAPPLLELPLDRPRPAVLSMRGETRRFVLSRPLSGHLAALSRRMDATLFMTMLAGFEALLWRWSGQRDLTVGTPIAGRNRVEIEPLIGFFVNTLVLRAQVDPRESFAALLSRAREESLSAYTHQDLPFEKLVEELSPQRSLAHSPLFQVMFTLQEAAREDLGLPGLRLRPVELDPGVAKFDLSLSVSMQADGRLAGAVNYNTSLFDASTALRLVQHLEVLLESASASAEARLDELAWLAEAERHQLTAEWRESASPYPQLCVHELFEEQARLRPDEPAVQFLKEQVSYGELNRRANRLAHLLRSRGVGPEARVGLCVERSVEMIVGMLGILKAGGVYVPLDPGYPAERLAAMLTDAGAALVVIEPERLGELSGSWEMLLLGEEEGQPETNPGNGASLENLAYLIYTSGTTDRPRGVMVEHRQWLHTLSVAAERFGPKASDRMACLASFSFDISLLELMLPLLAGGRVLLVSREELLNPKRLLEILKPVTLLHGVPSLMRHVVDWLRSASQRLAELRTVFVGGEAVEADLLARMREVFSPAGLVVLYGPTEATIICSSHDVPSHGEPQGRRLGRPLPGVEMQVVDAAGRRVAMGIEGELWVGGPGVSRGYLGRPDLAADRFRPASGGGRLYRTGDLARYTWDGTLEFLGRADGQVKVRGFRIEPGEIERVLLAHPQVEAVAVVVRTDSGDSRLAAYVVGEALEVPPLREHVSRSLPQHMVPSLFVRLEALPLLPNGKVDRRDLEQRDLSGLQKVKAWVAPRTPAEELMAGLWAEVLGQERVGAEDNFFDLGGHSLLGTQLISRARHAFGVDLPLRMLFERPTVAGLSRAVEEMQRAEEGLQAPPITRTERTGELPLSYAQERLWLIDQISPDSPLYNVPVGLELEGDLDVEALAWGLSKIVARHEALRTRFLAVEGRPVQVIDEPAPVSVPVVDGRTLPEASLRRLMLEEARRPFDLSQGPLLRALLLCVEERRWWLLLNLHHIVSDGWSMGVLVREVSALYTARRQSTALALPELPVQYADFARWQRDWLSEGMLEKELSYWRQRLEGAPPLLELPLDRPRPAVLSMEGGTRRFALSHALSTGLMTLSRRSDMTLFMTLLAGFQALLWRWSGQRDVSVGTPIAGRNRVETEGLIGFFVNTLVLRAQIDPAESFSTLLDRTREAALGAYTHQDVPFEKLVEELSPQRSLSYSPLFQVVLTVQEEAREELALPGLQLRQVELELGVAKFDLILGISRQGDGGLAGGINYDAALFDPSTAERLARHLEVLLGCAASSPESRLAELSWLGEAERHQLLAEWSDSVRPYPQACVHELFEEQARLHPDRPALEFPDERVSYGELNRRANRLAHLLRSRGVRPDDRVGLCVERSAAMVTGMLGILKAGGAYVPLDPGYPSERLAAMVEDAAVSLVVSEPERLDELPAGCEVLLPESWEGQPEEDLPPWGWPDSTAYVTFTSGSTGRPKGSAIPHRAVVRLVRNTNYIDLGPEDRLGQVSTVTFDAATFEVWGALLQGGVLVGIPREVTLSPSAFAQALEAGRVSAMFLTAALFNQVAREAPEAFSTVRRVLVGGEAVDPRWMREVLKKGRPGRLQNAYGPTEATTFSTWHAVEEVEEGARTIPIGRPLSNARAFVVDGEQRPLPVGVAGELLLGGDGLARGYERRPDLTAESFVPDGLSGEPGARLYRTGDVARWDREGRIEYLGRRDHQVKVRGFRIELPEIEAVLSEHPSVAQAVVLVRQVESEGWSDRQLAAWVVPGVQADPEQDLERELRRYVGSRLPAYMVPSRVVAVSHLPVTAVGKVDRSALLAQELTQAEAAEEESRIAPRTLYEELVAQIWAELLGRERVSAADDFFDLGGHSLLATQVVSRLQRMFHIELPLRTLFESSTVEQLARRVEEARLSGSHLDTPPIVPVPRDRDLPLSYSQERLWFFEQLEPGTSAYIIPIALRAAGRLDPVILERTLSEVVRRHEVLRTSFEVVDGRPVQVIHVPRVFQLPVVDLGALPAPERSLESQRLADTEAQRPFDLSKDLMLRATVLRLGDEAAVVVFALHHIAADGWSLKILAREVAALYSAFHAGRPSPLPDLPVQYADFSSWQRQLSGGSGEQRAYWKQRLAGAPPALELRTDRPPGPVQTYRGAIRVHHLPQDLHAALRDLSRSRDTTLFALLMAAFQVLLYRLTGQDDVVVGTAIAGRNHLEVEGLIGFFINMLPIRSDLSGNPVFLDVLEQVRETTLGAFEHQDVALEKLMEELQPGRVGGRNPFFQVAFGLRNEGRQNLELPGVTFEILPIEYESVRLDLSVWISEEEHGLLGTWFYNTDLFDAATVARMQERFATLLASIVAQPEAPLKSLDLLSESERAEQLERKASRLDDEVRKVMGGRRKGVALGKSEA